MSYYWVITKDRLYDAKADERGHQGTSQGNIQFKLDNVNRATFSLYDGDNECYYEGLIFGDYTGFEPVSQRIAKFTNLWTNDALCVGR